MSDNRISWTFDLQATCFRVTYKSSFLAKLVRKDLVAGIIAEIASGTRACATAACACVDPKMRSSISTMIWPRSSYSGSDLPRHNRSPSKSALSLSLMRISAKITLLDQTGETLTDFQAKL